MTERARCWQRHLDRWERGDLSQAEYCRRHGLKAVTFAWWKRNLGAGAASEQRRGRSGKGASSRKRLSSHKRTSSPKRAYLGPGGRSTSDARFVEVAMTSPGMAAYEVVLSRDPILRLPADFDPNKVSQLIAAVSAAC